MTTGNQEQNDSVEGYVFKNLIEAPTGKNPGGSVEFDSAAPFSSQNAAGEIKPMSFDDAGARGKAFGARFKKMSVLCGNKK